MPADAAAGEPTQLVVAAAALATSLHAADTARLRHSAAVADRAHNLSGTVAAADRRLLVAAAWLHDIGYAEPVKDTGFHPLDGARWLLARGSDNRIADLVAHHSGSRFVAAVRGLATELQEFTFAENALSDAITAADQTIGPMGQPMTLDARMQDMLKRHGPDSPNARAHPNREPYLRAVVSRVTQRLAALGPDQGSTA